jgi:hypothetical protein
MLQRVQTVYLSLALMLNSMAILTGFISINAGTGHSTLINGIQLTCNQCETTLLDSLKMPVSELLSLIVFILLLVQIFSYKNRKRQITFGQYALIGIVCIQLFSAYTILRIVNFISGDISFDNPWGFLCLLGAQVLILLANRQIKKDEELIRSIDRIR